MQKKKKVKKVKRKRRIIRATIFAMIVGAILGIGLEFKRQYNNPPLVGTWISRETDKEVEFTQDGRVNVDKIEIGAYVIALPDLIIYEIEGQTFEMNYRISNRNMVWSLLGEEEIFDRKGL